MPGEILFGILVGMFLSHAFLVRFFVIVLIGLSFLAFQRYHKHDRVVIRSNKAYCGTCWANVKI